MDLGKKRKMKCYLSPHFFIKFREGKGLLIEYKTHKEYPLSLATVKRIIEINKSNRFKNDALGKRLLATGIIALKPFKNIDWKMGDVTPIFHYGSKDMEPGPSKIKTLEEFDKMYLEFSKNLWAKTPPPILPKKTNHLKIIKLPSSQHKKLLNKSLWETLAKRKTHRAFTGKPITLVQLSTLLYTTFAKQPNLPEVLKKEPFNFERTTRFRRTSPGGGGIQATMAYVAVLNAKGLEPGIYFYDCLAHCLKLISKVNIIDKIGYLVEDQHFANQVSVGIFMTSQFNRIAFKYPYPVAYRVLIYDIGHLSQTLQLAATALGLNTWQSCATRDSAIEKILKIDTKDEQYMFFVGIGIGKQDVRAI